MPNKASAKITKAIFGESIDPKIHNKLLARQKLAENSVVEGESVQLMKGVDGKPQPFAKAIGTSNFHEQGSNTYLAELSSRTPWARAWVAVEIYSKTEATEAVFTAAFGFNQGVSTTVQGGVEGSIPGTTGYRKELLQGEKESITQGFEKKVYVLGNHNLNQMTKTQNTSEPIISGETSSPEGLNPSEHLPNQMADNTFKKPHSGITSIESTTEGPLGTIKRTTVNFVVHNFNDYQNIYSKYFLKPGATVFVDFGWDTANVKGLYNPQVLIESNTDIRTFIYGSDGQLDQAAGDMETLIGKVVNFGSSVDENGSFVCNMELISDNAAMLDYQITPENKIREQIIDNLGTFLINRAARNIGAGFLRKDFSSDPELVTESENYARSFAQKMTTSGYISNIISAEASKLGIFWKGIANTTIETTSKGWWAHAWTWPTDPDETADVPISDDASLYVAWSFFEEEILNKHLATGQFNTSTTYGGYFNSARSTITYDVDLKVRQLVIDLYEKSAEGLKFLYPESWGESYDALKHQNKKAAKVDSPDWVTPESVFTGARIRQAFNPFNKMTPGSPQFNQPYDRSLVNPMTSIAQQTEAHGYKMPFRELFVNVKMLKEAFQKHENVQNAIIDILGQLNEASYGVFDLKLISASEDNASVAIIDTNFYNSEYDEIKSDKFDNLFMFKPYTKGSIVKSMDINFSTPQNGVQNMVAIQNTSAEIVLHPFSKQERTNDALRKLYQWFEVHSNMSLGIRHLPKLGKDQSDKDTETDKVCGEDKNASDILLEDNATPSLNAYKKLQSKAQMIQNGEKLVRELDENGEAKEFDTTDTSALFHGMYDDQFYGKPHEKATTVDDVGEKYTKDPPDIWHSNAIYAKSLDELFKYRVNTNFSQKKISPWIPMIEIALETYGISGLLPGDIFNVDYLPNQFMTRTYFTVVGITQTLDGSGWTTKLTTQMRFRKDAYQNTLRKNLKLYLHPSWFEHRQVTPHIRKYFKDFQPTSIAKTGILVFEALGKKHGMFRPERTFESGQVKKMFKNIMKKFQDSYGKPQQKKKPGPTLNQSIIASNIKGLGKGKKYPYYVIVFMRGCFCVPKDEKWWHKSSQYTDVPVAGVTETAVARKKVIDDVMDKVSRRGGTNFEQLLEIFSHILNTGIGIHTLEEEADIDWDEK